GVGLGVTVLASLIPAWRGTAISVRAALGSYGINATYGQGLVDRLVQRLSRLPRIPAMALRNLARRKRRSVVTLLVIAYSTAACLAAQCTSASLDRSVNDWFNVYDIDAFVWFQQPVSRNFAATLRSIPTITDVNAWANITATIGDTRTVLWGIPPDSVLYRYQLLAGRWYTADDRGSAVISQVLAEQRHFQLGDRFALTLNGKDTWVTVIGIVADNINSLGSTAVGKVFVPLGLAANMMRLQDQADFFVVRMTDRTPA